MYKRPQPDKTVMQIFKKLVIKINYVYYLEKQSNGKNLTPGGQAVSNGTYVMSPSVVIYGQTD